MRVGVGTAGRGAVEAVLICVARNCDGVGEGEHACLRPFSCTDGHVASSSHDAPPSVETRGAPGTPKPRAGTDTSPTTSYHDTGELDEMERRCACDTRVSATKEDGSATLMYCREERDERRVPQDHRCPETPSKDTRTTPGHAFRFVGTPGTCSVSSDNNN